MSVLNFVVVIMSENSVQRNFVQGDFVRFPTVGREDEMATSAALSG